MNTKITPTLDVESIVESRYRPSAITAVPAIGNARYRPVRVITCPEAIEVTSRPPISGTSCNPEPVGVAPLTTCRNSGR